MTDRPIAPVDPDIGIVRSDPLSAVLQLVRTRGELLCRSEFTKPFGIAFPTGPVHFHAVQAGSIWVRSSLSDTPLRITAGAYLLFPHGDGHIISSACDGAVTPLREAAASRTDADRAHHLFRFGGGGDQADLACLRFTYDNPLARRWLETLPHVIVITSRNTDVSRSLAIIVSALLDECDGPGPGSAIMVGRLIDLLFIRMLRAWVAEHPSEIGWLAGAADNRIGRALAAVHGSPARDWTVAQLANCAGLARSAFTTRFTSLVGTAPMAYVLQWRLNLAADRLRETREPVGKIAFDLGYRSEAGFSRAFKARFGESPRSFRGGCPSRVDERACSSNGGARPAKVASVTKMGWSHRRVPPV